MKNNIVVNKKKVAIARRNYAFCPKSRLVFVPDAKEPSIMLELINDKDEVRSWTVIRAVDFGAALERMSLGVKNVLAAEAPEEVLPEIEEPQSA